MDYEFLLIERRDNLPDLSRNCARCRNLDRTSISERHCQAFPAGIPSLIWSGQHDHRSSFTGDGGVQFEPLTEADLAELEETLDAEERERNRRTAERWAELGLRWTPAEGLLSKERQPVEASTVHEVVG